MTSREAPICKAVCFNEQKIIALKGHLATQVAIDTMAARYKAMGHPARLSILHVLAAGECCVCDLANVLGLPVSTVSQHLRALKGAGLLRSRQDGKLVFYALADPGLLQQGEPQDSLSVQRAG